MAAIGYDSAGTHKVNPISQIVMLQAESRGNFTMREAAPSPDANSIIDRLRELFGVKNDGELATQLGLGGSALSNWRTRNAPPYAVCARVAQERGVSLDWLVFGLGARHAAAHGQGKGEATGLRTDAAARVSQFVNWWDATRDADELVWLEQQIKRAVPEYGDWLAGDGQQGT